MYKGVIAEQAQREWHELLESAENRYRRTNPEKEVITEITVAAVLGVGDVYYKPPEVVVVRDTDGKIWILEETDGADGDLQGLVSRHNARPGMKLRLRMKKMVHVETQTEVFPLTP